MKKLPKEIIVCWETPQNDEPFLMIHTDPASVAEVNVDVKVGIYRLVALKTVTAKAVLK